MQYTAQVSWNNNSAPFTPKTYDRTHQVHFGGGLVINASSAPEFLGNAALPNPEELFIAAINSCLMLTFLYWAAMQNIVIHKYEAKAIATLAKNEARQMVVNEVVIQPSIQFADGVEVDADTIQGLFKKAHEHCFISNSVKSQVRLEPAIVL